MQIYVVYGEAGEYSDHREWNVCAFLDKEKAKTFASNLNSWVQYNNIFAQRYWDEFYEPYTKINPQPRSTSGLLSQRVKTTAEWQAFNTLTKGGKKGSEEDNARFQKLDAEYRANKEELRIRQDKEMACMQEKYAEYGEAMEAARTAWVNANLDLSAFQDMDITAFQNEVDIRNHNQFGAQYDVCDIMVADAP